jgi:hypothetical protein
MPRYLISFDDGSMDHIPDADWPAVGVGERQHQQRDERKSAEHPSAGCGGTRRESQLGCLRRAPCRIEGPPVSQRGDRAGGRGAPFRRRARTRHRGETSTRRAPAGLPGESPVRLGVGRFAGRCDDYA